MSICTWPSPNQTPPLPLLSWASLLTTPPLLCISLQSFWEKRTHLWSWTEGRCGHCARASRQQPVLSSNTSRGRRRQPQLPASGPHFLLFSHCLHPWILVPGKNGPLYPPAASGSQAHTFHRLQHTCLIHLCAFFSTFYSSQRTTKKKSNQIKIFSNRKFNTQHTVFLSLSPQKTKFNLYIVCLPTFLRGSVHPQLWLASFL